MGHAAVNFVFLTTVLVTLVDSGITDLSSDVLAIGLPIFALQIAGGLIGGFGGGFLVVGVLNRVPLQVGLYPILVASQTVQILGAFETMLASVGSDLDHVLHITVYLKDMADFAELNAAYVQRMGTRRPARTVVAVSDLPKPGALLTMNLTAVTTG